LRDVKAQFGRWTSELSTGDLEMNQHKNIFVGLILVCLLSTFTAPGLAQSSGTIRGRVTLETSDKPVHNVTVTIIQLKRATETDDSGMYEFKDVTD